MLACVSTAAAPEKPVVAIQPLGGVTDALIAKVRRQVQACYDVNVIVKPRLPMPKEAYYPPRARYRAEKILDYLRSRDTTSTRIMGVTDKDISMTKGHYVDWGILGYGDVPGRACVVSSFRMWGTGKKKVAESIFEDRCAKIVAHELGHTFGLEHCPAVGCLMEDCKGTVKTVDREKDFCKNCKVKLSTLLNHTAP